MSSTIIVADDHPITARGMESILLTMGFDVLGNYQNGLHALNHILNNIPDFVLLDAHMPGLCGLDVVQELKKKNIKTKTIIYTMYTDLALFEQAKELGVDGYLLKEFALDDLKECLDVLRSGNTWYHPLLEEKLNASKGQSFKPDLYCSLTSKERSILSCIAENMASRDIAKQLYVSEKTIETHRRNIKKKLQLSNNKNALLVWAVKNKGFFSLFDE